MARIKSALDRDYFLREITLEHVNEEKNLGVLCFRPTSDSLDSYLNVMYVDL